MSFNKENHQLVQTIDIAPTLLNFFNIEIPGDMQGYSLEKVINNDESVRKGALFGLHGGHINYSDGRYVYMRAPVSADDKNLFNYTLLPTHISSLFSPEELSDMTLEKPLSFSKGCQVLKIRALKPAHSTYQHTLGDFLFDLVNDPEQKTPITDPDLVKSMQEKMSILMNDADAPDETYIRYGLKKPE